MTVTVRAQLLGLALTVFYTVVTAGYLWGKNPGLFKVTGKLNCNLYRMKKKQLHIIKQEPSLKAFHFCFKTNYL